MPLKYKTKRQTTDFIHPLPAPIMHALYTCSACSASPAGFGLGSCQEWLGPTLAIPKDSLESQMAQSHGWTEEFEIVKCLYYGVANSVHALI